MASERHKTKFVQSGMVESHDLKASIRRPCFANPAQPVRLGAGKKKKGFRKNKNGHCHRASPIYFFLFPSGWTRVTSIFIVMSESLRRHTVREGAGRRPAPPRCLQPYAKTCVLLKVPLNSVIISFPFPSLCSRTCSQY